MGRGVLGRAGRRRDRDPRDGAVVRPRSDAHRRRLAGVLVAGVLRRLAPPSPLRVPLRRRERSADRLRLPREAWKMTVQPHELAQVARTDAAVMPWTEADLAPIL